MRALGFDSQSGHPHLQLRLGSSVGKPSRSALPPLVWHEQLSVGALTRVLGPGTSGYPIPPSSCLLGLVQFRASVQTQTVCLFEGPVGLLIATTLPQAQKAQLWREVTSICDRDSWPNSKYKHVQRRNPPTPTGDKGQVIDQW